MSAVERGSLDIYEITWVSGYSERLEAHQVSYPGNLPGLFGEPPREPRIQFHGEFDGSWRLVLSARMADVVTVRNVSRTSPDLMLGGDDA